jgi:transcriptional regulator with XRE-family HTH domain
MNEAGGGSLDEFRTAIRQARAAHGMGLREAARQIGLSHSRLIALEQGRTWYTQGKAIASDTVPGYELVCRIAFVYGLPVDGLLTMAGHVPRIELTDREWAVIAAYRRAEAHERRAAEAALKLGPEDDAPAGSEDPTGEP